MSTNFFYFPSPKHYSSRSSLEFHVQTVEARQRGFHRRGKIAVEATAVKTSAVVKSFHTRLDRFSGRDKPRIDVQYRYQSLPCRSLPGFYESQNLSELWGVSLSVSKRADMLLSEQNKRIACPFSYWPVRTTETLCRKCFPSHSRSCGKENVLSCGAGG